MQPRVWDRVAIPRRGDFHAIPEALLGARACGPQLKGQRYR